MDRKRILIFDDDAPLLDVLQIIFLEGGYEVEVSQTCNNVIEHVNTFQPDLILMDYQIPEIGGAEAITILRNSHKYNQVPVILVSASTNIAKIKNTSGADDYLRKPFDINDLENIVNKYLS